MEQIERGPHVATVEDHYATSASTLVVDVPMLHLSQAVAVPRSQLLVARVRVRVVVDVSAVGRAGHREEQGGRNQIGDLQEHVSVAVSEHRRLGEVSKVVASRTELPGRDGLHARDVLNLRPRIQDHDSVGVSGTELRFELLGDASDRLRVDACSWSCVVLLHVDIPDQRGVVCLHGGHHAVKNPDRPTDRSTTTLAQIRAKIATLDLICDDVRELRSRCQLLRVELLLDLEEVPDEVPSCCLGDDEAGNREHRRCFSARQGLLVARLVDVAELH